MLLAEALFAGSLFFIGGRGQESAKEGGQISVIFLRKTWVVLGIVLWDLEVPLSLIK